MQGSFYGESYCKCSTKLRNTEKNLSRSSEEPSRRKICADGTNRTTVCNSRALLLIPEPKDRSLLSSCSWRIELRSSFYNKMKNLFWCFYNRSVHLPTVPVFIFVSPNFFWPYSWMSKRQEINPSLNTQADSIRANLFVWTNILILYISFLMMHCLFSISTLKLNKSLLNAEWMLCFVVCSLFRLQNNFNCHYCLMFRTGIYTDCLNQFKQKLNKNCTLPHPHPQCLFCMKYLKRNIVYISKISVVFVWLIIVS